VGRGDDPYPCGEEAGPDGTLFELMKLRTFQSPICPTHINRLTPNVMEHAIRFLKMEELQTCRPSEPGNRKPDIAEGRSCSG
jgi:hypothetical protein